MRIKAALMSGPDLATDEGLEAFFDALGVPDDEPVKGEKQSSHGRRDRDEGGVVRRRPSANILQTRGP